MNEVPEGPLVFTPLPEQGKIYRFVGPLVTGKVIAGIIGYPLEMASPRGNFIKDARPRVGGALRRAA